MKKNAKEGLIMIEEDKFLEGPSEETKEVKISTSDKPLKISWFFTEEDKSVLKFKSILM